MTDVAECTFCDPSDPECPGPGICHCGCGEDPGTYVYGTGRERVQRAGSPRQYVVGHWARVINHGKASVLVTGLQDKLERFRNDNACPWCEPPESCEVGAGFCHCGCGQRTTLWDHSRLTYGIIEGLPQKCLRHHRTNNKTEVPREIVRRIRYEYATDESLTQADLARRYGLNRTLISRIVNFKVFEDAGIATGP